MSSGCLPVLPCLLLSLGLLNPVFAVAGEFALKLERLNVVHLADGSEVLRLPDSVLQDVRGDSPVHLTQDPALRLLNTVAAQVMTARSPGQPLELAVEPAEVRSWAEFVDPDLAHRWLNKARQSGYITALLWRSTDEKQGQKAANLQESPILQSLPRLHTELRTTWRSVVDDGAARSLTGQQALQEWLTLPTLEPKANPWLSHLGRYRY